MGQNHDGSDKVTIKMKILGDAIYDIVINWLDDDCHPDVQVERQLASITQTPFVCHRTVSFFLTEMDLAPRTRPDWTRKSTFMNRFYGHQYVLQFHFNFWENGYHFSHCLKAEHLVDENECTVNFCPFIYNISRLKQTAKLANNNELKAKLIQELIGYRTNIDRHRGYQPTLVRHNVLHILTDLTCKLTQRNHSIKMPYLRTNG